MKGSEPGAVTVWQTARMELVLLACGLAATAIGTWRGYANARAVVAPLVHPGDATRTAVEATTPVAERRVSGGPPATWLRRSPGW